MSSGDFVWRRRQHLAIVSAMGIHGPEDRPTVPGGDVSSSGEATPDEIPRARVGRPGSEIPLPRFPDHYRGARRYEILGEHGRGGLGKVSRAFDRKLGRDVAIKELHSRGTTAEVRFLREVLITARLEHPGIVPIHEAGRWPDGTPYYAMKLVSGRSLRDLLAERPTFEQRIGLLHHVIAVADAIAYAHRRNIIHRDLKPANVIVGEFGETMVIDWGLAKDLGTPDVVPDGSEDFTTSHGTDVTVEGSVVGTPAYMAPEQKRGQAVDQRADVFAIGTMLWELCAVQKVPPKAHLRTRMLRRAGVDSDFAAIVNKALEPDRERRYPDAGALAADLKAFKSGARVAARDYSFVAMLAHWTRRHRTLALSATAAVLLAAAGSLLYVRNIAVERDRADRSLDELTLKHAELLLASDPSAAIDALASYHGSDRSRAEQIHAEAIGRGVAIVRAVPHSDVIHWAEATPDGAIISVSIDGTIARTYLDGTSSVLLRGVAKSAMTAYSAARHLLAYTCDPSDLCLFDIVHAKPWSLHPALHDADIVGSGFSPSGTLLAAISKDGTLSVLDVADLARPALRLQKTIDGGGGAVFVDDDVVAVSRDDDVELVHLSGSSERLAQREIIRWDSDPGAHQLALGSNDGNAVVVEGFPARVAARADLCRGPIADLKFIPRRRSIAYACKQGVVGIWELQNNAVSPRAQLQGHADVIATSAVGDYVIVSGGNATIVVIDLLTDLVSTYNGHGFRLTALATPGPGAPFVISGDVSGALRVWPAPSRFARVVAKTSSPFNSAISNNASTIIATSWLPALTVYSPSSGARSIGPHDGTNIFMERSTSGKTFATYGLQDNVEVWSSDILQRTRVIATRHGSVSQLRFVDDTEDFITSGHDGRLVLHSQTGESALLTQADQPIDRFAMIPATGAIIFSTSDGALWRVDHPGRPGPTGSTGKPEALRDPGARINRILVAPDVHQVYVGDATGEVTAIDTMSWQHGVVLRGSGAVRNIILADDGSIAVATNDGSIHLGALRDGPLHAHSPWMTLAVRARHIAFTSDGLLVASCTDGTIRLYAPRKQRWLCLPTGTADLGGAAMTPDGKVAVALDREGRLIWIDLDAARKLLDVTGEHSTQQSRGA